MVKFVINFNPLDVASGYLSGSPLIPPSIGSSSSTATSYPHQVSLREFLTSSPGPMSPLNTTSSLPSLITSPSTLMTASTAQRNANSPLNGVLTKAMSNAAPSVIALSPPSSLPTTSEILNESKQTKLILVEPQAEQSSTLQYLQSPLVTISSLPSTVSQNPMTTATINTNAKNDPNDETSSDSGMSKAAVPVSQVEEKPVSLTAAGTPRKREPVDPSRCIYPCDCCGKAFTTKFNLKRHINMHCLPSKDAGVPLQGPPSASQPSRKSREKREAKIASTMSDDSLSSMQAFATTNGPNVNGLETLSSVSSGIKKSKRTRQTKKRNLSTETSSSTSIDQSHQTHTKSNVQTIVTGSVALSSITNSNSPIVIQSSIVPNPSVLQQPAQKNKILSNTNGGVATGVITVEAKNKEQTPSGPIHVVQPKTITYQIGPSSDGTLQFTIAPPQPQQQQSLQSQIQGLAQNLNKTASSIQPICVSTESARLTQGSNQQGQTINSDSTKCIAMPLPPQSIAQLSQSFSPISSAPAAIRDLIEKHRPKISVTTSPSVTVSAASSVVTGGSISGGSTRHNHSIHPPIISLSNNQNFSNAVAVQMIQNLSPVEVLGAARGNSFNAQQPPRIVRLIQHPVTSNGSIQKTYITPLTSTSSAPTSIIRPQQIIQHGQQQITLQPPVNTIPTSIPQVPLIQLPPLTMQPQTIPTASLSVPSQAIQFPQQPIPLVQALSSSIGNDGNVTPKQIILSNSSTTSGQANLTEIFPQTISRVISGTDGNIAVQKSTGSSNNTLSTETVLAVRAATTKTLEQLSLPSAPQPNIAKISQNKNTIPTSYVSFLSSSGPNNESTVKTSSCNSSKPSVTYVENSPVVFGNTPPAEIFDSDDGEGCSSNTTLYETSSPPPNLSYHPSSWVESSIGSPISLNPIKTAHNDPFIGDSNIAATKSQPIKTDNSSANNILQGGIYQVGNTTNQVILSLQNKGLLQNTISSSSATEKSSNAIVRNGTQIKGIISPTKMLVDKEDNSLEEEEVNSESEYDDNDDADDEDEDDISSDPASLLPSNQFHGQLLAIPNGWLRKVVSTGTGSQQQQKVFYYNPVGKKFSNQDEIDQYFAKLGYSVGLTLFNFDPPIQQKNGSNAIKQASVLSEDPNDKKKKRSATSQSPTEGNKILSDDSENIKNTSRTNGQEKKNIATETKSTVRSPSKKKPKILDKSQPPESKGTERSLSLRNRTKTRLSSNTDEGNNLFVAIKTDPFAPTSILETQNINGDQGLGKIRIFALTHFSK